MNLSFTSTGLLKNVIVDTAALKATSSAGTVKLRPPVSLNYTIIIQIFNNKKVVSPSSVVHGDGNRTIWAKLEPPDTIQ